ncbi:MAG TPA: pseudouridine synthase [Oceanipulchritudo sp.]|nr:pseudouridine synthase [Oceanipulchritudo sp.]
MEQEEGPEGKTLLEWAQALCPDSPRKRIKEWIASGRFYLDGKVVTQAGLRLADPGSSLTIGEADSATASWANRRKIHPKVTILYLDDSVAIVDKGAGLLSVPLEGHDAKSALQVLGDYLNDPKGDGLRRRLFGSAALVRPLPVHRLDQYTSGLLCLALNEDARSDLIEQLRAHTLLREYVAFVDGRAREESGTWRHWLRLDSGAYNQRLFHEPVEGSTEAVTHYRVEKIFERHRVSQLRIRLETGLKHQIRIQAAAEGLPLIGDRLYHPGTVKAMERKGATLPYGFRRQALHACLIGLKHPTSGKELRFESKLPADLASLQARLE